MKKSMALGILALIVVVLAPVALRKLHPLERRALVGETLDPARFEEVFFPNDQQNLKLAGMLFLPQRSGTFPAAVIIQGSGASRRDNGWYLSLADYLQDHGVAVLLPDKRGSESSQGDWRSASFQDLATDAVAAVHYLEQRQDLRLSGIGIIGMSQGGWIAPIVDRRSPGLAFLVNVVGSAVSTHDQLLYEEDHNLRQFGVLPGISRVLAYASTFVLRNFVQKSFWQAVGDFDPMPWWREVKTPTLALYGAEDTNTPSQRSARLLSGLGKPGVRVLVFEGSGHALQDPPGKGNRIFRVDALKAINDFILAQAH